MIRIGSSRLDDAIDRGFDPTDRDDTPGPPLDAVWQAALDASVAEANALRARAVSA
jgi:hypothetical protein